MAISITPSPFGSITVTLDGELAGVLQASILGTSNSALNMDLGVPGPAGATGSQGPAGTNGTNGVGVAAGGTTGQALVKLSGTNYDTGWATITSGGGTWGSITGTLSSQTDLQNALNAKLSTSAAASTYQTQAGMSAYLSTSAAASTYLPLTGGTLTGNLIIDTGSGSTGHYETTEMFVTRNDATGTNANSYGALFNGGVEVGDATGRYAELNPSYLRFGDGTTQASAYNPAVLGNYLPLAGGTVTGTIFLPSLRNLLNTNLTVTAYNDTGAGTNFVHTFDAYDGTFALATNGGGLKFPDATVQVTAGLPLTGGTVSGDIYLNAKLYVGNDPNYDTLVIGNDVIGFQAGTVILNSNGISLTGGNGFITFADSSTQATAFIPSDYLSTSAAYSTFLPLTGGTMSSTGINGIVDANTWSFGYNGLSGYNDASSTLFNFNANSIYATSNNGYDTFTLNPSGVSGTVGDDPAQSWSFGIGGLTFSDSTVQTTAFTGNYLPLTGGTLTGDVSFNLNNEAKSCTPINLISSNAGVDTSGRIELRGFVPDGNQNNNSSGANFDSYRIEGYPYANTDSDTGHWVLEQNFVKGENIVDGTSWSFGFDGLQFGDSTTQTTAGIPEAPIDGNAYVRKNGAWVNINDL
jgi:hypothetical protein